MPEVKAIMIGSYAVGKTSILAKFISGNFEDSAMQPTLGLDYNSSHF